jgi:hypothetical protein
VLHGRFGNTSGRPYLEGRLFIPRSGIQGSISFLVDTGADTTTLLPDDSRRLGVDYSTLKLERGSTVGIGGAARFYAERAIIVFTDPGKWLYAYEISLSISPYDKALKSVHSLLGRDILDRWQMTYGPSRKNLRFAVLSADLKIRL